MVKFTWFKNSRLFIIKFSLKYLMFLYIFSPSSAQCQPVTGINTGYGHLMLSDTQFFLLGVDNSYQLQMYKITFGSTSVNWANKIICPSLPWGASNSESYQSLDGTTIYSLFTYGNSTTPTYYLYFASLSVASGSVMATRYKSSISIKLVYGGIFNGDYIVNFYLKYIIKNLKQKL